MAAVGGGGGGRKKRAPSKPTKGGGYKAVTKKGGKGYTGKPPKSAGYNQPASTVGYPSSVAGTQASRTVPKYPTKQQKSIVANSPGVRYRAKAGGVVRVKTQLIPPISGSSMNTNKRKIVNMGGLSKAKYAFPGAPSNTSLKRFDAYNARQPGAPAHNVEKQSAREQAAWRRSVGIHKAY